MTTTNRYMKHTKTGTIHIFEPSWLRQEDHSFVECDEHGNYLNDPIEGESTVVTPAKAVTKKTTAKTTTKKAATKPKTVNKVVAKTEADAAVDAAIDAAAEALSKDASKNQ